jgi:hypothetical protein
MIPGSAWRGAVAAQLIEEEELACPEEDPQFKLLFLSGSVRFGDLRPSDAKPWPLSARCCKMEGSHPIKDLLVRTARQETLKIECERCEAKLGHPPGYFELRREVIRVGQATARVVAHSAISNSLLRVRQEQFFSGEVVDPAQTLMGELWADPDAEAAVGEVFKEKRTLRIGRGRTRGMGIVELGVAPKSSPDRTRDLLGKLETLNRSYGRSDEVVFTATLLSQCVVLDEWLLSRPQLEAADIAPDLDGYILKASYGRMTTLAGWNAQAGLPKPDVAAIAPGSCFLFGRSVPVLERKAELEKLAAILAPYGTGLGEYWEEGLGEVEYCSAFHFLQGVV